MQFKVTRFDFCILFSLFYLQLEVRVEEKDSGTEEDQGEGQEEASPNPPPAKKRASLNLLENLLGATFSRNRGRDVKVQINS